GLRRRTLIGGWILMALDGRPPYCPLREGATRRRSDPRVGQRSPRLRRPHRVARPRARAWPTATVDKFKSLSPLAPTSITRTLDAARPIEPSEVRAAFAASDRPRHPHSQGARRRRAQAVATSRSRCFIRKNSGGSRAGHHARTWPNLGHVS